MTNFYLVAECKNGFLYPQIVTQKTKSMPFAHSCMAYTGKEAMEKFLGQGFIRQENESYYFTNECILQLFCGIDDVRKNLK